MCLKEYSVVVGVVVASQVTLFCWTLSGNDLTRVELPLVFGLLLQLAVFFLAFFPTL